MPLVSRILPSDICKIHKKGSSIRLDTTLLDFNDMKWERGDISFVFNGNHVHHKILGGNNNHAPLVVMDNKLKVYQLMTQQVCSLFHLPSTSVYKFPQILFVICCSF